MATGDASVLTPTDRADDLLTDDPLYEVIDGVEVAKPIMGVYEGSIASTLCRKMGNAAEDGEYGQVVSEVMFRIRPDKRSMRRPDVAYVSYDRWGRDQDLTSGNGWDVIPDLVVEVVSPTDLAVEVMDKVHEYLDAGVVQVWLVYPNVRQVLIYDKANGCQVVGPEGALDGGTLLPGFRLALVDLFRNKAKS